MSQEQFTGSDRKARRSKGPMRLLDYLGLFRKWPPAAHDPAGNPVLLEHCLDTLVLAFTQPAIEPRRIRICILTEFQGVLSMREVVDAEDIFALVFCGFLNKHRGQTIAEIGEMDVAFLA
jgi:hypothetical protein